jgi:site-specific DNA recombinase
MPTRPLARRAAVYCRISEDREGSGLGVERQRDDCEAMAKGRGWDVAGLYVDNDVSAFSGKVRHEYQRLLHDIEDGSIEAVVVWHLDRLHRQPKELESFIDLVERHGVALASVSGEHDLSTPEGRLHARILGAVARMESEHKSRRIKRKKVESAKAGLPSGGGNRAYGYSADQLTVVPDEATIIREAADRLLAGDSLRSVVLDLNARRCFTSQGKPWIARSLKRVLTSPRTAGLREHPDVGTVRAVWEPILERETYDRLCAVLNDPRRDHRRRGRPRRHLLSGILRCGECGTRMVAGPTPPGRSRVYICMPPPQGCQKVVIVADWVEEFVSREVMIVLRNVRLVDSQPPNNGRDDLDSVAQDEALLNELATAYANRRITMSEWLTARQPIEARIAATSQRVSDRTRELALRTLLPEGTTLEQLWPTLSIEKQRTTIETVLDHIIVKRVGKGSYRDTSRLVPAWRV